MIFFESDIKMYTIKYGLIFLLFYCSLNAQTRIVDFDAKKHLTQTIALIESEKDLAFINYNKDKLDKMLVNANPFNIPFFNNRLRIKLLYENEKMIGVITYSQLFWIMRHIGILVVDKEFRGKGHAKQLLEYAVRDNGKENARVIMGQALSNNKHAIEIYTKLGAKIQQPSSMERAYSALVNVYNKMRGNAPNPQITSFVYDMRTLPIK